MKKVVPGGDVTVVDPLTPPTAPYKISINQPIQIAWQFLHFLRTCGVLQGVVSSEYARNSFLCARLDFFPLPCPCTDSFFLRDKSLLLAGQKDDEEMPRTLVS